MYMHMCTCVHVYLFFMCSQSTPYILPLHNTYSQCTYPIPIGLTSEVLCSLLNCDSEKARM